MPVWPGMLVFASAGAAAARKGSRSAETLGLSAFVFAGAAQMVAIEVWQLWTPATILAVAAVTASSTPA